MSVCNVCTMKICILLSGLQRNFEPFIENQLNLVINAHDLDVLLDWR